MECHSELSNKRTMIKNLQENCLGYKTKVFNLIPLTFEIRLGKDGQFIGIEDFESFFNLIQDKRTLRAKNCQNTKHLKLMQYLPKSLDNGHNVWILKPTDYNRGRGISVFADMAELRKILKSQQLSNQQSSNTSGIGNYTKTSTDMKRDYLRNNREKIITIYGANIGSGGSAAIVNPQNLNPKDKTVKSTSFLIQK